MSDWTAKQQADAMRAAMRVALAGQRHDLRVIAEEVRAAADHELLVYSLARLPGVMIASVSARDGQTLDPEEVLTGLLDGFPDIIDPQEN